MKARLLTLAPLFLLLAGCGILSPEPDPTPSGSVIMPLEVGNQWIAKYTQYDEQGNKTDERFDTLSIVSSYRVYNETMFRASTEEHYVNRGDGLWSGADCNRQHAKYPARKDDLYNHESIPVLLPSSDKPIMQTIAVRVLHTDTTVTVPAGTFKTYHYAPVILSPTDAKFITPIHSYYAPNVGPVLIETFGRNPTRWELVKAVLK